MVILKRLAKAFGIGLSNRSEYVWKFARELYQNTTAHNAEDCNRYTYPRLRDRFIANGNGHVYDSRVRRDIVTRFQTIDENASLLSTPSDGLFLAEAILNTKASGDMVECGCFTGGSAAKLSIVAKIAGRRFTIFDSFEGLPAKDSEQVKDLNMRTGRRPQWTAQRYAADVETVRKTIEQFGESSVCTFVKGWFSDTLTDESYFPREVAFAFTDVDMAESARDCLRAIWPRLSEGGVYFSHDVAFLRVLHTLYDQRLWQDSLGVFPPILFGAGFGMCDESPHLGFFVKDQGRSCEYVKQLMIYR